MTNVSRPPLVLQLQQDALDRTTPVTELLRKALLVARKLGQREIEEWIRHELNGYPPDAKCPPYRELHGQLKGWNPFHGWQPVFFENPEPARRLTTRSYSQTVSEIEHLLGDRNDGELLMMPFEGEAERVLQKATGEMTSFGVVVSSAALAGIVEGVRNAVLDWTLKLEEQKVLGEEFQFTPGERAAAATVSGMKQIFSGPIGTVMIQQASPEAVQVAIGGHDLAGLRELVATIREGLPKTGLTEEAEAEISADLGTMEAQLASPKPKIPVFRQCLGSVGRVLENAAGNVAAHALLQQIVPFLAKLSE